MGDNNQRRRAFVVHRVSWTLVQRFSEQRTLGTIRVGELEGINGS